ncbi:hypothetical protein HPB47_018802 [Ixodes persulcatus]|uniref:Uncharacterized protein n=1 Tax=Ixodes persulcatus TaxID=34615 RepID=A0AC60QJS0_IXOPE|nr:hypothetical protein HPB47_018802 [Ixodes persulcatus]
MSDIPFCGSVLCSTKSIKDFNPTDENDYDKNGVYSTYWEDKEKCENSGIYSAQILLLAYTREDLEKKRTSKRLRKAVVHPSDFEAEDDTAASSDRVSLKQGKKRQKEMQQAAKNSAYECILQEQLSNSQRKNSGVVSAISAPGRRKRQLSDSDSDTDESVVSSVELKRAKTDAAFWRRRYTEACQEKAKLTNIIESMQRTSDGKLAARVRQKRRKEMRRAALHHCEPTPCLGTCSLLPQRTSPVPLRLKSHLQ